MYVYIYIYTCRKNYIQYMLYYTSLHGLKKRGVWGARSPPPICKHYAPMMGFKKAHMPITSLHGLQKPGVGVGGLQTQCSHDGFEKDSYTLKHACTAPRLQTECSHDGFQKAMLSGKLCTGPEFSPPICGPNLPLKPS